MGKIWHVPNIARSVILPELVNVCNVRDKAMQLFSSMYNVMCNSQNAKINLLCKISVHSTRRGIIGENVVIISNLCGCGFDSLTYQPKPCENAVKARAAAIKDITACIEGGRTMDVFDIDELIMFKNYIACF